MAINAAPPRLLPAPCVRCSCTTSRGVCLFDLSLCDPLLFLPHLLPCRFLSPSLPCSSIVSGLVRPAVMAGCGDGGARAPGGARPVLALRTTPLSRSQLGAVAILLVPTVTTAEPYDESPWGIALSRPRRKNRYSGRDRPREIALAIVVCIVAAALRRAGGLSFRCAAGASTSRCAAVRTRCSRS